MKYFNEDNALVIKSWCENPEDSAIEQAKNLSRLPFAFKQICLMPDTHQGYGMPIGGVLATKDVIIPNAVGVDIGCGMGAVKSSTSHVDKKSLKKILDKIRQQIPVGFKKHSSPADEGQLPMYINLDEEAIIHREYYNARLSVGTLGGGNHFLEIQKGNDGFIWIMVHSGSRNLGKQVADHYNKKAIELNTKWHSKVPKEWELAFLSLDSDEGQLYLQEMQYCVDFALCNRQLMMEKIQNIVGEVLYADCCETVSFEPMINIAHNYARMENHFSKNVMVHRKGATSARDGEIGLIPGSQGTSSYIVRGKGNPESFMSCSHGAGRAMGRKQAERTLNLEDEQKKMDDRGILHSVRGVHDLDEAPGAYKDILICMAEQSDLVDILVKLEPLAVMKG